MLCTLFQIIHTFVIIKIYTKWWKKAMESCVLTWRYWVYPPHPSEVLSSPSPTWPYQERWHRSGQLLADLCWSVCPAENRKTTSNSHDVASNMHLFFPYKYIMQQHTQTDLEAANLCVLAFLAQSGVDPVEDDLLSNLLSIAQIWQNKQRVPEGRQAGVKSEAVVKE